MVRALREEALAQLRGVRTVDHLPIALPGQLRERAAELLRDPRAFQFGAGCGGGSSGPPAWAQETRIGRYVE